MVDLQCLIDSLKRTQIKTREICHSIDKKSKKQILVAEDDEDLVNFFKVGFSFLYDISFVSSIETLEKVLQSKTFALLILDEWLEGGRSSTLIDELKKQQGSKIIFFTAGNVRDLKKFENEQIVVLQKPDGVNVLFELLAEKSLD